jgi:hypothetical protein
MINRTLQKKNFTNGRKAELEWLKILKKQYPTIIDNNLIDIMSSMDGISFDNNITIEHEHKNRIDTRHNKYSGIMVNECKIRKSIEQLKKGIRQIYYWSCSDGLYYWELTDIEKQRKQLRFYRNGNFQTGEGYRNVVDIKHQYLKKYEF